MFAPYQNLPLDIYLVGGAVRDQLLNRPVKDHDYLVVGANSKQMLTLDFIPVGKDFPVFLHPKTKAEFALARTERKQGKGYTGFTCYAKPDVTIEEDLLRRDLTINAMAMNSEGIIIDPYNGQQDLKDKILRHVSPAFSEDPLRVLRVARFAARYHHLGFTIAAETLQLMTDISLSGELNTLSAERIWQEMSASLGDDNSHIFFEVLRNCQALKQLWPELDALWGIPNPARWHPEICSGIHTMMVLQQASLLTPKNQNISKQKIGNENISNKSALAIRFAALCHDLGKGLTDKEKLPSHQGHEKSGLALVEKACSEFKVQNNIKQLALLVCEYHLHSHKAFELKASTIIKLFNAIDIWRKPAQLRDFLTACEADFRGRLGLEKSPYPQFEYLLTCAQVAQKVNAKEFVEQGLQGIAIKEAMYKARLNAVKAIKAQRDTETSSA
ncbi:MAG: multifunctional CCA addition/repair protein [Gammaproteobacteria bacterium]|nr:MAG: multifunctional CCA addition/repair protein [Gammaproteobacteria bacterium]